MKIFIVFLINLSVKIIYPQSCSNFENLDRSGPWYAYIQTIGSIDACCSLCDVEGETCQSWLFLRASTTSGPGCYLRHHIPPINETSFCGQNCFSGFKKASLTPSGRCAHSSGIFELAVNRPGNVYAHLSTISTHYDC